MKTLKRIVAVVATLALTVGMTANCFAASWEHYFGMDEKCGSVWYEGAECDGEPKTSDDGWTAKLKTIGWGGIWGAQMFQKVTIKKGTEYQLKCTLKSSKCDKWVFIKISKADTYAYGKWIRLEQGEYTTINETFIAAADADQITFGFGGEFGDRESTDGTKHYAFADGGVETIQNTTDEDATYSTTIKCQNFYLGPTVKLKKTSIQKIVRTNKKAKITLKKVKKSHGYQIKYSADVNFSKKDTNSITRKKNVFTLKKLEPDTPYYIKARAYRKNSGIKTYGSWSKIKVIPAR